MNETYRKLADILDVSPESLEQLDKNMSKRTGTAGVLDLVYEENIEEVRTMCTRLGLSLTSRAKDVRSALRNTLAVQEKQFSEYLHKQPGDTEFEKAKFFARRIARVGKGFFLKRKFAEDILRKSNPKNLLQKRGYDTIDALLAKEDVFATFSALRFVESDEWMHNMFAEHYSTFTADDFEERDIHIEVLGPEWADIAEAFVAKKHHNVSHLKEFGVIFINPIREDVPGKLVRDFALLLHYFHEIAFYAKLFKKHAFSPDFSKKLQSFLRGDILEQTSVDLGAWLIVQRYLWKEDPKDARLFLPRINPESMHWGRGERDLVAFFHKPDDNVDLEIWNNLDWPAYRFPTDTGSELVSFDLEDTAMSLVSAGEGKDESFTYHEREALWTHIGEAYAGGEDKMEKLLVENFDNGIIRF